MRAIGKEMTLISNEHQSGFTLIEIALVLLLVGLIMTPAIQMYHQYRVNKDWNETEYNIDDIKFAIGGFRNVYGRYPCPASVTAVPGDIDYGHELSNCQTSAPAPGTCSGGICTYSNGSGVNILVGTVPFKILNLTEKQAYDSSLSRITYAVTLPLTSNTTYNSNGGGINIVDKNNPAQSLVSPPNSAHFVIISHGKNKYGAYTRAGIISENCTLGSLAEQENCDADTVFASGDYDAITFDDRINFFSPVQESEWQESEAQAEAITLKNTNSSAIGANITDNLAGEEAALVKTVGSTSRSGIIRSSQNFYSEQICDESTGNCFRPELIAGTLDCSGGSDQCIVTTTGTGMSCNNSSSGDYMVAIENNDLVCSDEIFVTCADNQFISEIDNGNIVCATLPGASCDSTTRTATCGDTVNVPAAIDGAYATTYTGECRKITNYDASYFSSIISVLTNPNQIKSIINLINLQPRTIVNCDTSPADSQVRDAWLCTNGTFSTNSVRAHEKNHPWSSYPSNPVSGSSPWPAETWNDSTTDPNNNQYNHDCWCREDYRARVTSCPGGLSGNRIIIEKHTCPQTSHQWTNILTSDAFCACASGTTTINQSCNSYYDEVNGTSGTTGLTGTVIKTFDINCVSGVPVTDTTPSNIDTSQCACPSKSQIVNRTYCPTGLTNSWSWTGGNETGVATLSTQDWVCPGTSTGGLPDPGSWGSPTPYSPIPACTCDSSLTENVTLSCPTGQQGSGIIYKKEWDCTLNGGLGDWEPQSEWDLIANNCDSCAWQAPTGSPTLEDFAYGVPKGDTCSCGSPPATLCHAFAGAKYSIWSGCPCVVQDN